jgi:DHA1 family multidrug resistance protein-like MFS transporter
MFNAIYQPIQQDIATQGTDSRTSGAISGMFNAVRSVGMIAGALFSGLLYTAGNKLPFICTSILFFVSAAISYLNHAQYNNKVRENING